MSTTVISDLAPRLKAAGAAVRSAHEHLSAERELRDELIVAAVDNGMSQRQVAAAAGVSLALVTKVLLYAGGDD